MGDVVLTGYLGTGKTSVGRLLAQRHGLKFVDTDEEIERRAGCSIAELWATHEEPYFRDLEHAVWRDLLSQSGDKVMATGGGLLIAERNRALLTPKQHVLCLECDVDELGARLWPVRETRPHLARLTESEFVPDLRRRLEARCVRYEQYEQIDTAGKTVEDVATRIAKLIGLAEVAQLAFTAEQCSRILFGDGLLDHLGSLLAESGFTRNVLLVTDEQVTAAGWRQRAEVALNAGGFSTTLVPLPTGEEHKTLATVEQIYQACALAHLDRGATIVGLGGGVVGDLAGLVAATYLRGIRLVLAPTTLLAQVDAAIGGKVGVDFAGTKNLIGAFYPARLVVLDPSVLVTLPATTLADGLAEIVKIGVIRSAALLDRLEVLSGAEAIRAAPDIIRWAAQEKVKVVQSDPYEHGERVLLNFGHTVGHGLEAASGYRLSHGQAVSAGMVAELRFAVDQGWCPPDLLARVFALLTRFGLPTWVAGLDANAVYAAMRQDKKREDGRLRLAVPTAIGQGTIHAVGEQEARAAIACALREAG